jgi:hypothetical protein
MASTTTRPIPYINEALELIGLPAVTSLLADGWHAQVQRISLEGVNVGEAEAVVREELESSRKEISVLREELCAVHDKLDRVLDLLLKEKGTGWLRRSPLDRSTPTRSTSRRTPPPTTPSTLGRLARRE